MSRQSIAFPVLDVIGAIVAAMEIASVAGQGHRHGGEVAAA
jgi:hypothetical protein